MRVCAGVLCAIISHASDDGNNPPPSVLFSSLLSFPCSSLAATARVLRFSTPHLLDFLLSSLTSTSSSKHIGKLGTAHTLGIESKLKSFLSAEKKKKRQ